MARDEVPGYKTVLERGGLVVAVRPMLYDSDNERRIGQAIG